MEKKKKWVFLIIEVAVVVNLLNLILADGDDSAKILVKRLTNGNKVCRQGIECSEWSKYCCNKTVSDIFDEDRFDALFPNRNSPVAHANGFWDYRSFIAASAAFQPLGFATTGGDKMQAMELAAFFAHVASRTSCGHPMAVGGEWAWGLCYNKELSPSQSYCAEDLKYPCAPGAEYFGRGALPLYWNVNYGEAGAALNVDLLNHPEYLEQNATLSFSTAISKWMTTTKRKQPSAHKAFLNQYKFTKNDTFFKRGPGFGTTMNVLHGDYVCDPGNTDAMSNMISHYKAFLDLMEIGQDQAGPDEELSCAEQAVYNPSSSSST